MDDTKVKHVRFAWSSTDFRAGRFMGLACGSRGPSHGVAHLDEVPCLSGGGRRRDSHRPCDAAMCWALPAHLRQAPVT